MSKFITQKCHELPLIVSKPDSPVLQSFPANAQYEEIRG